MKKILIIGTGPSGISVLEYFKNENYKIDIVDGTIENFKKKGRIKKKDYNDVSPKYNSLNFDTENKSFKKKNKLSLNNFFLSSTLSSGGGTKFWGSGIEIPSKTFYHKNNINYKKYAEKTEICKEFFNLNKNKKINNQIETEQIIIKDLVKNSKEFKIEKLNLSIEHKYNHKKLPNYFEESYFNSSSKIIKKRQKKINYSNLFVKKISKKKKFNVLFSKKIERNYDYIFCCAGNISSTIIVSKLLKLKKTRFRIYHNPMFLIICISLQLVFKKSYNLIKNKLSLPCSILVYNDKKSTYKGSLMRLKNLKINDQKFSIKNFFFNLFKKYLLGGNFFLEQKLSKSYLYLNDNKYKIMGQTINFPKKTKSKLNGFLFKNFLIPLPFLNLKKFKTGSDAHYTSTLFEYNKKYKIINSFSELYSFKNFFILDGSIIPPGLFYPTFFQVLNNFVQLEKIKNKIKYEKK